ncbi:hypothetical protein K435DRAFT_804535 [Dendrothele bispora CBS 962.96]|uniref:DUF6534 domain-containing protein n=1 Tax=Dendrothele bispora (strain CBS 962.96) TaxID=1314807 RepID=A0A4V4HDG6_DENBC|nr:hypothetical protein K435DRAFT_804535 [Dendrothele bispora CBS 962.96]
MSVIPPQQIQLKNSTGPIYVGTILNWMLMGSLIVQLYNYYLTCSKDRAIIKFTVSLLFICDVAQTALATDFSWKTLVSSWGDPTILVLVPKTALSLSVVNPIISGIVQMFFAWQVIVPVKRRLSVTDLMYITGEYGTSAEIKSGLGLLGHKLSPHLLFFVGGGEMQSLPALKPGFTLWLVGNFVADIFIALCMVYLLMCAKTKSFSKTTEGMLSKLVINAIHTGAVTAIVAAINLALFVSSDTNGYYEAPAFMLGKLYSNVLLANLNARAQHKQMGLGGEYSESDRQIHDNAYDLSRFRTTNVARTRQDLETGIVIHTETIVDNLNDEDHASSSSKKDTAL